MKAGVDSAPGHQVITRTGLGDCAVNEHRYQAAMRTGLLPFLLATSGSRQREVRVMAEAAWYPHLIPEMMQIATCPFGGTEPATARLDI